MSRFYITKQFSFEMAHALTDYPGKCRNIHGHSYRLEVTVTGDRIESSGMVIDFKHLKDLVNRTVVEPLDHFLVLSDRTDDELQRLLKNNYEKVKIVPFQPSTENLLEYMAKMLAPELPGNVSISSLRLQETEQSWVELKFDHQ